MKSSNPDKHLSKKVKNKAAGMLADTWNTYQSTATWFWRHRAAWVLIPAISVFVLVYWFSPDTASGIVDGVVEEGQRTSTLVIALGMALLAAVLFAFYVAALHSIVNRRFKWAMGVFVFPPAAFIYLWVAEK